MPTYPNFPSLCRQPALKTKQTTLDPTLRDSLENGMESTRAKFTRLRREFDVTIEFLSPEDAATLDAFVETTAVYGAAPFNFTDPRTVNADTPTVYVVRFSKLPAYTDAGWVAGTDQVGFSQNVTFSIREM